MPTIIVEDGSGVANANSYTSLSDADVYFGTRLFSDVWASSTESTKQIALIQSARTLDSYMVWFGLKADSSQAMQWPRVRVYEQRNGSDEPVELVDVVPNEIRDAQCELAIHLLGGDRTVAADTAGFSELSISGAISFKVDSNTQLIPAIVHQLVGKFGNKKGGYPITSRV